MLAGAGRAKLRSCDGYVAIMTLMTCTRCGALCERTGARQNFCHPCAIVRDHERARARMRKFRAAAPEETREKARERFRRRYAANPEKFRERLRKRYYANLEKARKRVHEYQRKRRAEAGRDDHDKSK